MVWTCFIFSLFFLFQEETLKNIIFFDVNWGTEFRDWGYNNFSLILQPIPINKK